MYSITAAALAALALAAPLAAQAPLSLAEALRRADRAAYANRIAGGTARADQARAGAPLRGILPAARLEASWMRTDDPVAAFGTLLRQRGATPASFDPAVLNDPAPISDMNTGAVVEMPLFNADAWLGRRAARAAGEASAAGAGWVREGTRVDVVRAYYGALLARARVATLQAAVRAARDHVRQAEALATQGIVTRSDALLAAVKAGEVEAELLGAAADAALARSGLAVLLGDPADTSFQLPDSLPAAERARAVATMEETGSADDRADVRAARLGLAAARADVRRATSLMLPRINAFGRYDWHAPSSLAGGTPMWTIGVMAQWALFSGASEISERRQASGRLDAARAGAEAAAAQAGLDASRRTSDLQVALQRLTIADRAVAQAAEAHRIVSRKYEGGIASVVELLDASAAETATLLRHAAARYDVIVAAAAWRQSRGLDLAVLATLDN